jgi:hypothetical protein
MPGLPVDPLPTVLLRRQAGTVRNEAKDTPMSRPQGNSGQADTDVALAIPWTEDEYRRQVADLVADETPAMFAVVEDRDDRSDGWVAAWVLEFRGRAEAIGADGVLRMTASSADRVRARFGRKPGVTARLVPFGRPFAEEGNPGQA